jgi:glutaredoxin
MPTTSKPSAPLRLSLLAGLCLTALATVQAQQVYRQVLPDGRVVFTDRPPEAGAQGVNTTGSASGAANNAGAGLAGSGNASLPFELRQVVQRHPVTLYTSKDCGPCSTARNLFSQRGVPFTERTVETNDDIAALQQLSGGNSLPFATIGTQPLRGFSDLAYQQYLDAAGYPKTSALPRGWRNPAPAPLTASASAQRPTPSNTATSAPSGSSAASTAPAAPAAPITGPGPSNPAGIRF